MKQPLRVGFDLDGVLLYNPLRIIRHPIAIFKRNILNIKVLKFYYPKTRIEKFIWRALHLSSIFIASGLDEIEKLVKGGYIKAYIITARYEFLKDDTKKWHKKLGIGKHFKALYHNTDKQPHLFKEHMIKKLKLDIYIDDNYDIVKHTDKTTSADIFWVYNILDVLISYKNKCTGLPAVISKIKKRLYNKGLKKKVLLVTEYYYPHWTGVSKSLSAISESIKNQGFDVSVLTVRFKKEMKKKESINGISIHRVPYLIKISRTHYSLHMILELLKCIHFYDQIIINSPNSNILISTLIAKVFRKKVSIFHQGDITLPKQTGNRIKHKIIEQIFETTTLSAMNLADHLSCSTRDYAEHSPVMKHFLYKFSAYVPNVELSSKPASDKFKSKLKRLKKKYILIGFAGRFVEEKGFDILLKAIPHVIAVVPNARFLFAGKTDIFYEPFFEKHKKLVNKQKKYLEFLGLLSEGDLTKFYENLDVFAISSRKDCFPLTQLEAVSMSVPIVTTDTPGARMLVKETGFGEIVKLSSPRSLARGLIKVIRHRKKYVDRKDKVTKYLLKNRQYRVNI